MKRKLKLALASVCVVAAGFGGMKAYNHYNNNQLASNLLSENVEALSESEAGSIGKILTKIYKCGPLGGLLVCYQIYQAVSGAVQGHHNAWIGHGETRPVTEYYSNGHIKKQYTQYLMHCESVDGGGDDSCSPLGSVQWF